MLHADGGEQIARHILTDHSGDLQDRPRLIGKPIEPRCYKLFDSCRYRTAINRTRPFPAAPGVALQRARLEHVAHNLLDEQRCTDRALDHRPQLGWRAAAEQGCEQGLTIVMAQLAKGERTAVVKRLP